MARKHKSKGRRGARMRAGEHAAAPGAFPAGKAGGTSGDRGGAPGGDPRAQALAHAGSLVPPRGDAGACLAALDRLWPVAGAGPPAARVAWLLKRWPARAVEELQALAGPPGEALVRVAASAALALSEGEVAALAALPGLGEPWLAEARLVREAGDRVAAGETGDALGALRGIGLRSPFRGARLFLRGLAAYYERQDEDAARALSAVRGDPVLGHAARQLLMICSSAPLAGAEDAADAGALALLGCAERLAVARIGALVRAGRGNAAIREAEGWLRDAEPVWGEALMRELAAALLSLGMRPQAVVARLRKMLPPAAGPAAPDAAAADAAAADAAAADAAAAAPPAPGPAMDRLRVAHLTALLADSAGKDREASAAWREVERLLQGEVPGLSAEERRRARAGILAREAARALDLTRAEDAAAELVDPDWSTLVEIGEMLGQAVAMLEQAVELVPDDASLWLALVSALEERADDGGRQPHHAIERMVAALPEHPEVLRTAARAAAEREAWDKALRYIRRAVAIEPMSRVLRDAESSMLLGKARKQHRAGRTSRAVDVYDQAVALPHRTAEGRLEALAEAAAFHVRLGDDDRAGSLRAQALQSDARPWLWAWFFLLGNARVDRGARARPEQRRWRRSRRRGEDPDTWAAAPDAPPTRDELLRLLDLARAHEEEQGELATALALLVNQALARGHEHLAGVEELTAALALAVVPAVILRVAERGRALRPREPVFVIAAYSAALALDMPRSYFETAEDDIGAVIDGLGFGDERIADEIRLLAAIFDDELAHPLIAALELREQVRARLARTTPPGRGGGPGAGRQRRRGAGSHARRQPRAGEEDLSF